jgi:hypothetical protein
MTSDSGGEIYVRTEQTNLVVEARAVWIGADILVFIWGGDRPHIGAVAAAQPRPSLSEENKTSATCSVLTFPGHKEDEVVKLVSESLSAILDTNVVVTAGIHWDEFSQNEIRIIRSRVEEITRQLAEILQKQERSS